jgi:type I restriction enzyme S subunit
VGYTAISYVEVAVNQGFIAIPPTDGMPSEFVLFWLREHMDQIKAHAGGTTFAEISKRAFRPLPMVVPTPEQLGAFADAAGRLVDLMATLERELQMLSQIRDGLLPRLVSGEIRVPDANHAAEVVELAFEATAATTS